MKSYRLKCRKKNINPRVSKASNDRQWYYQNV